MEYSTLIARLKTASESFENLEVQLADPDIANDPKKLESIARERSKLEPLVIDFNKLLDTDKEIEDSKNLLKENRNDKEMESLINEELITLEESKNELIQKTTIALLPKDPRDERSVMLEIRAGAGGNEACIWAGDLARMYERYGQKIGWSVKPVSASESDMGGFKELVISVKGDSVYSQLKFEAGVHRVQRVPATESPLTEITNSLNPPISDSEALTGFTDHPIFCPYLSYILAKSPAQIHASLPPAPALISNITLLSSLGSLGNKAIVIF